MWECYRCYETENGKYRFDKNSESLFRCPPPDTVLEFLDKYDITAKGTVSHGTFSLIANQHGYHTTSASLKNICAVTSTKLPNVTDTK